ncbi:MAG: phosphomethylpyrimidine synthase ThiC [Candidatus Omnitrophota bacterium]
MYKSLVQNKKFYPLIKKTAKKEGISATELTRRIQDGSCVITHNNTKKLDKPCAIGRGLTTKVNVNIGTSTDKNSLRNELKKLDLSIELGADAIMDLSLGGNLAVIRKTIIKNSPLPIGTVPIYEAAMRAQRRKGTFLKMEKEEILDVLRDQAISGVDFFTVHCGINQKSLQVFLKNKRLLNVVSRGGALIVNWMRKNNRENPFYEYFDDILKLAKNYNITLSLGDGMRPGSILDATDPAQIAELKELGKLTDRCHKAGVQVIIEGPGHVPLHQIKENMELQKKICKGAPFYVLGPLVTDVAIGYDHISGAIGGALAAFYGADFLCYLTPAEHVRHPSIEDARDGLIASKIAAHAADIAKGLKGAIDWDKKLSLARRNRDWAKQMKLAIDPRKAHEYRKSSHPKIKDVCTMCGEFCSIRLIDKCLNDQ